MKIELKENLTLQSLTTLFESCKNNPNLISEIIITAEDADTAGIQLCLAIKKDCPKIIFKISSSIIQEKAKRLGVLTEIINE